MFKELMPKNEVLGTVLDTIFITLGGLGGIAGLITYRWKTKYQAKIQAEMQTKADELSQTLNEKITRRSKAFDYLTKQEFEFYDVFNEISNRMLKAIVKMDEGFDLFYKCNDDNSMLKEICETSIGLLSELSTHTLKYQSLLNKKLAQLELIASKKIHSFNGFIVDLLLEKISIDSNIKTRYEELKTEASQSLLNVLAAIGVIVLSSSNGTNPETELDLILNR